MSLAQENAMFSYENAVKEVRELVGASSNSASIVIMIENMKKEYEEAYEEAIEEVKEAGRHAVRVVEEIRSGDLPVPADARGALAYAAGRLRQAFGLAPRHVHTPGDRCQVCFGLNPPGCPDCTIKTCNCDDFAL